MNKLPHNIVAITLFLLLAIVVQSQESIYDSLTVDINNQSNLEEKINRFHKHIWDYARIDPNMSLQLLDDLNQVHINTGSEYDYDVMLYYYGVINKNIGRYQESEYYLLEYEDYVTDSADISRINIVLSNLYREQFKWVEAIERAEIAADIFTVYKDTTNLTTSLMNIGFCLSKVGRAVDAIPYIYKALDYSKQVGSKLHEAIAHSNLGLCYQDLNQLDSAEYHFLTTHKISEDTEDLWGLQDDKRNLALFYFKKGFYEYALSYALGSHDYAMKINSPSLMDNAKVLVGEAYIHLENYPAGFDWLNEVQLKSDADISPESMIGIHRGLYQAYKNQGIYDQALKHKEIVDSLNRTYNSQEVNAKVRGVELQYQTTQKEKEIELLNLDKEHAENRLQTFRIQILGLGIFSTIILGLLVGLFSLYRKSKDQQIAIHKNLEEKNILLKEIHHRVKNNLQVISSLLNLQSKHVDDLNAKSALEEGRHRVKSMALIHQRLYQDDNLLGVGVKEYFEKLIQSLYASYKMDENQINLKLDIDDLQLDVDTLIPLGLIVNELISNALKHAFPVNQAGLITVSLREENQALFLNVSDNGVGSDQLHNVDSNGSFGFRLIRTFSKQLDADIAVDVNQGTSIRLRIQDYKKVG